MFRVAVAAEHIEQAEIVYQPNALLTITGSQSCLALEVAVKAVDDIRLDPFADQ